MGWSGPERRHKHRYDLALELMYKNNPGGNGSKGFQPGMCVNMSSQGIFFVATTPLKVGVQIEIMLEWPVERLDAQWGAIEILAKVVRTEEGGFVAATFKEYQFKFRAAAKA
jgi:hypothetical protein